MTWKNFPLGNSIMSGPFEESFDKTGRPLYTTFLLPNRSIWPKFYRFYINLKIRVTIFCLNVNKLCSTFLCIRNIKNVFNFTHMPAKAGLTAMVCGFLIRACQKNWFDDLDPWKGCNYTWVSYIYYFIDKNDASQITKTG